MGEFDLGSTDRRAYRSGWKGDNLWDYWYKIEPNRFYQGQGPEKTSTFYEHWEEDLDLLLETGHTAFRNVYSVVPHFPRRPRGDQSSGCRFLPSCL